MATTAEPSPRRGHFSAPVEGDLYVWGGYKGGSKENDEPASSVYTFNQFMETWTENESTGPSPIGLFDGACAASGHHLYLYGGLGESQWQTSLHQLDTKSWSWKRLSIDGGPMRKGACGMVAYEDQLVLFGGHSVPHNRMQTELKLDGRGWTNEIHTFDLDESKSYFCRGFSFV